MWFTDQVLVANVAVDCGPVLVSFYNDDLDKTELNSALFEDIRGQNETNEFIVKQTNLTEDARTYLIKYSASFENYSSNIVEL